MNKLAKAAVAVTIALGCISPVACSGQQMAREGVDGSQVVQERVTAVAEVRAALAHPDGWWASGSFDAGRVDIYHLTGGSGWAYATRGGIPTGDVHEARVTGFGRVDDVASALPDGLSEALGEGAAPGWRYTLSNSGTLLTDIDLYLVDGNPDRLEGGTRMLTFERIDAPAWAPDGDAPFDQVKAEAAAMEQARAAGAQVFTGTVAVTSEREFARSIGTDSKYLHLASDSPFALLELDSPTQAEGVSGDPLAQGAMRTRDASSVGLQAANGVVWTALEGQRVSVAASAAEMQWPSDVRAWSVWASSPALVAPIVPKVVPYEPTAEEGAGAAAASEAGDYVLADSDARAYSRAELEALDDHTLFLARNEIYARHGRQFLSEELQQYFGSKAWYSGTIAPSAFDDSALSDVERANASLILEIEKGRGSPYL